MQAHRGRVPAAVPRAPCVIVIAWVKLALYVSSIYV